VTSSWAESSVSVAQSIGILVIVIVSVTSTFLNCHFNAKRRSSDDSGTLRRVRKVVQRYRYLQVATDEAEQRAKTRGQTSNLKTCTFLRHISLDKRTLGKRRLVCIRVG